MTLRIGREYVSASGRLHHDRRCHYILFVIIGALLAAIAGAWVLRMYASSAFESDARLYTHVCHNRTLQTRRTAVVATIHGTDMPSIKSLYDSDFGVETHGPAILLRRRVEFCQWDEFSSTRTDSQGRERTRYLYTKTWRSVRIPSLLFDDPITHHNPWRNPFPAVTQTATTDEMIWHSTCPEHDINGSSTHVVPVHVDPKVFDAPEVTSTWTPRAPSDLFNNDHAIAARAETGGFRYLGDGWFFSPHDTSVMQVLLQMAGRLATDVLDVQVGDFLSHCTAGDVRVRFEQVVFNRQSAITVAGSFNSTTSQLQVYCKAGGCVHHARHGILSIDEFLSNLRHARHVEISLVVGSCMLLVAIVIWSVL